MRKLIFIYATTEMHFSADHTVKLALNRNNILFTQGLVTSDVSLAYSSQLADK